MSDQTTQTAESSADGDEVTQMDRNAEMPTDQTLRDTVQVLLDLIPDQQRDDENSNSSQQRQLLEDIRWTVVAKSAEAADRERLAHFESIMTKQNRLIAEIQKRTRMLVGV